MLFIMLLHHVHNICEEGNAKYIEEWNNMSNYEVADPLSLGPHGDDVGINNAEQIRSVLVQYVAHDH